MIVREKIQRGMTLRSPDLTAGLILFIVFALFSLPALAQTGGTYDLSHNVIASGGGSSSSGGSFSIDGTSGQGIAGTVSTGGSYSLRAGFWAFGALAPTAAGVSVSGRITSSDGRGIRGAVVTLTSISNGSASNSLSSTLGYYRFENVVVGHIYTVSVSAKQFSFEPSTRMITVFDELTVEDFIALPEQSANEKTP